MPPQKGRKGSKKVKVEAEAEPADAVIDKGIQGSSAAEDVDGNQSIKKARKKRRGPSGFALVGNDVSDTPADRRARLKAARVQGEDCTRLTHPLQ